MSCSNFNPDVPSTSSSNAPDQDSNRSTGENDEGRKSVTVLISDTGEITYDEETLQSIIGNISLHNNHTSLTIIILFNKEGISHSLRQSFK